MKIQNIIFILLISLCFTACEVVPEGDRFEEMEYGPSDRTVLLIEFTGVRCINCPSAAAVANDLIKAFPKNIVVVGMHPDGIISTDPLLPEIDFRTKAAMEYLKFYGGSTSTGFPTGVINGKKFDSYLQPHATWTSQVISQRAIQPECIIELSKEKAGEKTSVDVRLKPKESLKEEVSLQMWLLENNITGPQAVPSGYDDEYVHNHVFRENINDLWGDDLGIIKDTTINYTFDIDKRYKEDKCSVVAVLINTKTKEVIQAQEIALGKITH